MGFLSNTQISHNLPEIGVEMYNLMEKLYPICRSITGDGVRKTLDILSQTIPLKKFEVPTGTKVFDWVIPNEWNINDAYVLDPNGKKIINFKESNLHVLNYSIPIHKKIQLNELKKHLYTIPEQPDLIPYRTTYYDKNWGFCLKHNDFINLQKGEYEVVIDSTLKKGNLTYGECYIPGKIDDEILISCYVCHPSMCNDNLSGVVLATRLAKYFSNIDTQYSLRFLFIPETIGAITWLYKNEKNIHKIKHGLVATCVGDSTKFKYKKTRRGNTKIDQITINSLKNSKFDFDVLDFFPTGSDERQFCSPGFNLPVGQLFRGFYGTPDMPYYHTSGDNLNYVKPSNLAESFSLYYSIIVNLEHDLNHKIHIKNPKQSYSQKNIVNSDNSKKFINLNPKCEPQLGKRKIYNQIGGQNYQSLHSKYDDIALLWVLNFSDGENSLIDIQQKSKIDLKTIEKAAHILTKNNLLQEIKQ